MAFLDAFAKAADKTRGWKLDRIKFDNGYQFVYVRYTGRKFAGKGLMASAFAPVHQYRDGLRAANFSSRGRTRSVDASPIRTPSASAGRSEPRTSVRATLAQFAPLQRVNITLRLVASPTVKLPPHDLQRRAATTHRQVHDS